jgi:hypothetical protein
MHTSVHAAASRYSHSTQKLAIQLHSEQVLLLTWQKPWWKVNQFSVPQTQIFQLCRKTAFMAPTFVSRQCQLDSNSHAR